jgi:hypothetical protein
MPRAGARKRKVLIRREFLLSMKDERWTILIHVASQRGIHRS